MTNYTEYTISGSDMVEVMVEHHARGCAWTHFDYSGCTAAQLLAVIDGHAAECKAGIQVAEGAEVA